MLLPLQPEAAALDFDQFQRYSVVAQLLDRMLTGLPAPVRVLEVGANVLNLLPLFLDAARVRVTRCDVERFSPDPDFVVIDRDRPLPFDNEAFDAVLAAEVLEHLPAGRRREFMADCLRVARHGAVFTCPNGTPEVRAAEELVRTAFQRRHGYPHPFLTEHQECGLPSEEAVLAILQELDVPHAVFDNAPLPLWLAMLLLSENLAEGQATAALRTRLNGPFLRKPFPGGRAYRKVYACARTFQATPALEPLPGAAQAPDLPSGDAMTELLLTLAQISGENLGRLEQDLRNEAASRKAEVTGVRQELAGWQQQYLITNSLLTSMTRSRAWKLLAPLRALRQLLRPRGFDERALIPSQQLEPIPGVGPGRWLATGHDPQFIVPCLLPAGWVHFQVRLSSPVQGRLEFYADTGHGFSRDNCIERLQVTGRAEANFFVRFAEPVRAIRLDPLDVEGEFCVERLEVRPVAGPRAFAQALVGKVRLLWTHGQTGKALRGGWRLLRRGQFRHFLDKIGQGLKGPDYLPPERHQGKAYQEWRKRRALTDADRGRMRAAAAAMPDPPLISVLMPVYNCPEAFLRPAIESVLRQTYPLWELCIADDASTAPHIRPLLEEYAARDPRVRVVFRPTRGHIAAASNSALALARGEYVALLDHDDEIAEHALFRFAEAIVADRGLDMIYSDEDKLEVDGRHVEPFFKPDWSPEYFLTCMYTCHLGAYRTALVREVGGFRSEYDTAQDYDLALRIVARSARVGHVPDVLYHWRKAPGSTALSHVAKPRAHVVAGRAVQAYLDAIGREARVEPGPVTGLHRVRFALRGRPRVSIVIPTGGKAARIRGRDTTYLATCLESIRSKSTYRHYEIIVVDNGDLSPALKSQIEHWEARRVTFAGHFNLATKINLGASQATGEHLVLLNDDIEVIADDWLECLLEYSQQPEIGAVGSRLLFPDGRLQHVGVLLLGGSPTHPFYGEPAQDAGYGGGNVLVRNYLAVTGACMMTRTEVFRQVGGFDEGFPLNYNDVDYCLKVVGSGRRIVYTPYAELYHHEGATKTGVYQHELDDFHAHWGAAYRQDPYYNPNLSNRYHDYRIKTEEEEK